MATDMEASIFIMFNMHVHAYVHACMCVHAYACVFTWDTALHPHTHPHHIHPSAIPQDGPPESVKIQ